MSAPATSGAMVEVKEGGEGAATATFDTTINNSMGAIPTRRTLLIINNFIINTTDFMNKFAALCERKLNRVAQQLTKLEIVLSLLEAKLESIPWLSDVAQQPVPTPSATPAAAAGAGAGAAPAPASSSSSQPAPSSCKETYLRCLLLSDPADFKLTDVVFRLHFRVCSFRCHFRLFAVVVIVVHCCGLHPFVSILFLCSSTWIIRGVIFCGAMFLLLLTLAVQFVRFRFRGTTQNSLALSFLSLPFSVANFPASAPAPPPPAPSLGSGSTSSAPPPPAPDLDDCTWMGSKCVPAMFLFFQFVLRAACLCLLLDAWDVTFSLFRFDFVNLNVVNSILVLSFASFYIYTTFLFSLSISLFQLRLLRYRAL